MLRLILAQIVLVALYLAAALVGGIIPHPNNGPADHAGSGKTIHLVAGLLHTDIAIPVNQAVKTRFAFMEKNGIDLGQENLKHLIIGWGSREFYTSTKNYSDIGFATTWIAVSGDRSVMHVQPAGKIEDYPDIIRIELNDDAFSRLLSFIETSFDRDNEMPVLIDDATFGSGDVFYEAVGGFDIFRPCNVWTSRALRAAGVNTGLWTPTTYSVKIGHQIHN